MVELGKLGFTAPSFVQNKNGIKVYFPIDISSKEGYCVVIPKHLLSRKNFIPSEYDNQEFAFYDVTEKMVLDIVRKYDSI